MPTKPISPIRRAWFKWKALRLPWRKRFLVGLDLSGATFWEFRDKLSPNAGRMRRIVSYPHNVHHSDVASQITPAWHQWLRHTRADPPSLAEQEQDVARQARLKVLAAEADARWALKRSYLDQPPGEGEEIERAGSAPAWEVRTDSGEFLNSAMGDIKGMGGECVVAMRTQTLDGKRHAFAGREQNGTTKNKGDPWKKAEGGPSEKWQPQAWDPSAIATRR